MHETLAWADLQDCGNAQAQLILLAIARNADWNTGICETSQSTLSQMAKCCDRTIRRYLSKMEQDGLISREERRDERGYVKCDRLTLVGYSEWVSTIRKGGTVESPKAIKPYHPADNLSGSPADNLSASQSLISLENPNFTTGQNQPSSGQQVSGTNDYIILDYIELDCKDTKNGFQKYDLKHLGKVLFEAAGPCLDDEVNCLGLLALTTPQMWLESGADLYLDIIPTLKAFAVKYRGKRKIRTWDYFTDAIAACKSTREAGLPDAPAQKSSRSSRPAEKTVSQKSKLDEAIERAAQLYEQEVRR